MLPVAFPPAATGGLPQSFRSPNDKRGLADRYRMSQWYGLDKTECGDLTVVRPPHREAQMALFLAEPLIV